MDAIKEFLRAADRLEHEEISINEYEKLCEPLRDVRENVHGKWIDVNGDGSLFVCGNCHESSCCNGNYCPDCGAIMDER